MPGWGAVPGNREYPHLHHLYAGCTLQSLQLAQYGSLQPLQLLGSVEVLHTGRLQYHDGMGIV